MRDQLNSTRCSKYLKALSDPERLRIVQCLQEGGLTVSEIAGRINSPIANASHHLKQLRIAGLIAGRKKGRNVVYSLAGKIFTSRKTSPLNILDFGCCRLELGQKPTSAEQD
jgi:DNA-binding transcriptional ArsR family regulator